jgi:molecular chaperone HscB
MDHFARLGMRPDYRIDAGLLDRRYFEQQRLLHPDRFATRTARERALSQQQATTINEAYETLRDPLRRADYLLFLSRDGANPNGCNLVNDPDLLSEAMEMREELAGAESLDEVASVERHAVAEVERCVGDLADAFATDHLDTASHVATRLKYLRKLADDCRGRRLLLATRRES